MTASTIIKRPPITGSAILGLVFLGMTWGLFFSLSRFAGETEVKPLSILAYTLIAEVPLFGLICIIRGRYPRLFRPASMVFYLMAGILGYMIPAILELYSAPIIGAGLLTIVVSLTPVVTVIIAFAMRTDHLNRRKIIGVFLASLAMLPILFGEKLSIPIPDMASVGLALAIAVPLCYGFYHNFIAKFWPEGEDGWQLATGEMAIGCLTIVPMVFLFYGMEIAPVVETGLYRIMIGYIVLSAASIYLYFFLLEKGGPIFVSLAGFVSLIAGVFFGMVFFGETHPWWVWLSVLVIIGAIWLATSGQTPDADPDELLSKGASEKRH